MRLFASYITTERLIEQYHKQLYWYIRRMVVSHEDAQDVLQNTFMQVYLHLSGLRDPSQERAWMYRIATNEALMWLRNRHLFLSLEDDDASGLLDTLAADPYTDTADSVAMKLQEAVLALPTMQRTVFNLRYFDELSYEEIAAVTGSSVAAAKTNYHYAKQRIMKLIEA